MLNDLNRKHHDGSPIRGDFRLTGYWERQQDDGSQQGVLTLEDASGRCSQIIADEDPSPIQAFRCPGLVRGVIQPVKGDDLMKGIVLSMEEIGVDDIDNGAALLPRAECSDQALPALRTVFAFNASISTPELRSFLNRVLLDEEIAYPLMSQSAGSKSAHPYKGGLLAHGTDWLDEAGRLARLTFPVSKLGDRSQDLVAVTQIGYLFHDLYRAILDDLDVTFSDRFLGKLMVRMLEPHLDWLAQQNQGFARDLRTLLLPEDEPSGVSKQMHLAQNIIRGCDNQWQTRDLARACARQVGEPAANDPIVEMPMSPWTVSHV